MLAESLLQAGVEIRGMMAAYLLIVVVDPGFERGGDEGKSLQTNQQLLSLSGRDPKFLVTGVGLESQ